MDTEKKIPEVTLLAIESMEPAARRILIAQDALDLLRLGLVRAHGGQYIDGGTYKGSVEFENIQFGVYAEQLLRSSDTCHACALGVTLIAAVRRFNDLHMGALVGRSLRTSRSIFSEYLSRFFEADQLALMEASFEGSGGNFLHEDDPMYTPAMRFFKEHNVRTEAEKYNDDYLSEGSRLVAIFENVLKNNGTFILPQAPFHGAPEETPE